MVCTLFDLKRMRRSELVLEIVKIQKDDEYIKSEVAKMRKELEEVHEEMKFREIVSEKKDLEISRLRLQVALQGSELDKRKRTWKTKLLAVFVSLLFGVTAILFNIANSLLTSNPPNPLGTTILAGAFLIYIACAFVTTFILEGNN